MKMHKLAKALYDNTAECADELAFRKGDIVTVMDQNATGTSGWWMCSLYGRHGLAPANRLRLLPQTGTIVPSSCHITEKNKFIDAETDNMIKNIYQIPSVPQLSSSQTYELMDMIYKVPSAPLTASKSPDQSALKHNAEGFEPSFVSMVPSAKGEVYDIPCQARRSSVFNVSPATRHMPQCHALLSISELEKRLGSSDGCSSPEDSYVYAVPPPLPQDTNYDISVPSATDARQKATGYNARTNPQKLEWIYDVPVSPEKPKMPHDIVPSKALCLQLYDTLPAQVLPIQKDNPKSFLYDIPKSSSPGFPSPPDVLPRVTNYNKPPAERLTEEFMDSVLPQEECLTQAVSDDLHLECRDNLDNAHKLKGVHFQQKKNFLVCPSFQDLQGSGESRVEEDSEQTLQLSASGSERISMASNSSTSSCDSLPLSSSSLDPLREVTLSHDEACRRIVDLQESVCTAVPCLMKFVSSHWRSKEHLEKYLKEIKEAAEEIASSLTSFLNFALDIKGNAHRLTDASLRSKLYKQLSVVEDSGMILQEIVSSLNIVSWPLNTLCQDLHQVQTPDQLERFVMVARTVPEDVKYLVSIITANGKLLFRTAQKEPEFANTLSQPETTKSSHGNEQGQYMLEDDSDYIELQADGQHSPASASGTEEHQPSSLSEHCRLYFGALQKAIGGFVDSLQDGQPPEKFISQSKLVIMVGRRLVDTLCKEPHCTGSSQTILSKSNHLCALLKQLAVATKNAALHFPDRQALEEVQEFAKELAQRAQHFRISLDI